MPNKYLTAEPIENLTETEFKTSDIPASFPTSLGIETFKKEVSKLKKGLEGTVVKVSVIEVGATDTKAVVRIEAPSDSIDAAKSAVLENISNVYSK